MSKVMRGVVTAMAAGVAAVGFGVVAAAPAQATVAECRSYLVFQGYPATTPYHKACEQGAGGRPADCSQCYAQLRAAEMVFLAPSAGIYRARA